MTRRCGVSLMELLISLSAATMLMVGLAATMRVTFDAQRLVDDAHDDPASRLRSWMRRELATAVSVRQISTNEIALDRPSANGAMQTIRYQTTGGSLRRRVDDGSAVVFADGFQSINWTPHMFPVTAEQSFHDGLAVAGESGTALAGIPRIRGFTFHQADSTTNRISLPIPDVAQPGDLLLAIGAINGWNVNLSIANSGWDARLEARDPIVARSRAWTRTHVAGDTAPVVLNATQTATFNGVLIAIANINPAAPIAATNTDIGNASLFRPAPPPMFATSAASEELSIEYWAFTGDSTARPSLAVPGFNDVFSCRAAPTTLGTMSLHVVARHGSVPDAADLAGPLLLGNIFVRGAIRIRP